MADIHVVADVNDKKSIDQHVSTIKPLIVTSDQSDISTAIVARLNQELGLFGNDMKVIEKFTDKYAMYKFAIECGVPVPHTCIVNNVCDVKDMGNKKSYPIIIKPTDATMSRGFHKFNSEVEVTDDIINYTRSFSKSKTVITQNFVSGDMITLEGVCSGGKHRTVATSMKDGFFTPGINCGVRYPCKNISDSLLNEIIESNDYYVEKSGMKFGLTHSEYIVNKSEFNLIEIGARGGGAGIIDKIVPWVSGINPYDILYESLIGNVVDVKNIVLKKQHALLKYYLKENVINCDDFKIKIIRNLPGVADFQYDFIGQQYVKDVNDIRHSMGIYLGNNIQEIDNIVSVIEGVLNPKEVH